MALEVDMERLEEDTARLRVAMADCGAWLSVIYGELGLEGPPFWERNLVELGGLGDYCGRLGCGNAPEP